MEIVRKEEDGDDDEEEELKTILFYQFEYIPNQTPKVCACFFCSLYLFFFVLVNKDLKRNNTLFSSDFGAKENGEQMDKHHFAPRFRLTWIKHRYCIWLCIG
jgi:hypothetical protein